VLSTGGSWSVKRIGDEIWHLRHGSWSAFYWKVDTDVGVAVTVTGGTFGREGGRRARLDAMVKPGTEGGFEMVFAADAKPEVRYALSTHGVEVAVAGTVLTSGEAWQARELDPMVFHLRHDAWEGTFWQVELGQGRVLELTGGMFGFPGGKATEVPCTVTSSRTATLAKVTRLRTPVLAPEEVVIHLSALDVVVNPSSGAGEVSTRGTPLDTAPWQVRDVKPGIYHLRRKGWNERFWAVDTTAREAVEVVRARFGAAGASGTPLGVRVTSTSDGDIRLSFGSAAHPRLTCATTTGLLSVTVTSHTLGDVSNWTVRQVKPHLIHLKHARWEDFFWSVNAASKRVTRISGGPFGVAPERIYGGGGGVTEDRLPFEVSAE